MINNKNDVEKIICNGKLIKKLNINSNNFNSEAYIYRWLDNLYVVRKVGKQYNLSTKQLAVLEKDMCIYYKFLKKLIPVNLPRIFFTKIDKQQNIILLVTEYFPKGKITDIKNIPQKVKYFKTASELIIKLASSNKNLHLNKLICSIDPNPENFFINQKGEIVYNDFTPPLFRKENGLWNEFRRKDEIHVLKSEKETRYFIGANLFLNFVNKIRIYLPFNEYTKFIKWACKIIRGKKTGNKLSIFPEIFEGIKQNPLKESCYKFRNYAGARDLLRFAISLNKKLTLNKVRDTYRESKKLNGVLYLEKKLKYIID